MKFCCLRGDGFYDLYVAWLQGHGGHRFLFHERDPCNAVVLVSCDHFVGFHSRS